LASAGLTSGIFGGSCWGCYDEAPLPPNDMSLTEIKEKLLPTDSYFSIFLFLAALLDSWEEGAISLFID